MTVNLLGGLLSFAFPEHCPFCGSVLKGGENHVCEACRRVLPWITGKTCPRCGRGLDYCRCRDVKFEFASCAAPFYYEGAAKSGVERLKFYGKPSAADSLARIAAVTVKKKYAGIHFDAVTAVPLSRKEKALRGYNQSALFAEKLAGITGAAYKRLLTKPRDIPPQRKCPGYKRWENVEGAFVAGRKDYAMGTVLLADDVVTTGATLNACARALKAAGVREIICIAISIVR